MASCALVHFALLLQRVGRRMLLCSHHPHYEAQIRLSITSLCLTHMKL